MTTDGISLTNHEAAQTENLRFGLLALAIFMVTIGVVLLLFSMAYIEDMETLRNAPEAFWNFVCGVPSDSPIVFPLLLAFALVSFLTSGALLGWRWWLKRSLYKRKNS